MTTVLYDTKLCRYDKDNSQSSHPTNMSVRSCNFFEYNDCNPTHIFKFRQEPSHNNRGTILLNPSVFSSEKRDKTFREIEQINYPQTECDCKGKTFFNSDPRLCSAAERCLQLDIPPLNSTQPLKTIGTDKSLDGYGQHYKSYSDVNAGQYLYYIGKEREDVFYEPLFSNSAITVGKLYKDPMGSVKPQYDRIQIQNSANIEKKSGNDYNLSFIKDSQFHREDLLALQMRTRNQRRYSSRWNNIN